MIILPRVRRNGRVDLLIALDQESISRMQRYDHAEVLWDQLGFEYSSRRPATIGITFCSAAEMKDIERMSVTDPDWKEKAYKLLTRGFEFRPDKGDHDFGPTVLGKPTEGTKQ
jgi:hypothetical protein